MLSHQQLHKIGLAHQDKVQTGRQTGQVTVTVNHNREERKNTPSALRRSSFGPLSL